MITYQSIVTFEVCEAAFVTWSLKFTSFTSNFDVPIASSDKKQSNLNSGLETKSAVYCNKSQVKYYTFETLCNN